MGNPSELAKKYYDQGADELFYIDIVTSLYRREILFNDIERVALDMPQLLERKIKDSNKVNMFPVHEYWLDIGQTEQLHQAQKDVSIL